MSRKGLMSTFAHTLHRCIARLLLGGLLALAGHAGAQADQLESWRPPSVPGLTLPALDGPTSQLGAEAGKLVIVHFFATWCEPCRDELKSLERLAEALAARPFQILAVDVGEPGDRVRRFLERNKISLRFPVLIDFDKQAMRAWVVEMLPTSYVLDGGLCPLWKVAGALEWDVGPTLSMIEAEVATLEQAEGPASQENCIAKGGTR
jgi:thiol-disulfide isomerase/thioredoxin